MRRTAIVIGVGLVLAVSGGIGIATTSGELEESPAPAVARVVPDSGQDLDATIISLQDTLRRVPRDHDSWANLAVAYVEQARVTGLASYYEKADEATSRSFSIEPDENLSPWPPGRPSSRQDTTSPRHLRAPRRRWPSTRSTWAASRSALTR